MTNHQSSSYFKPTHSIWSQLTNEYVSSQGKVNYLGLKQVEDQLDQYLNSLSQNPPNTQWPESEQMAYWINAYNAFTIKLILIHYPVASIKEIKTLDPDISSPWHIEFFSIGQEKFNLHKIEHEILRKQFKDPRIHFAINCASNSCPILLNTAYNATELNTQLNHQTHQFLTDPNKNQPSNPNRKISKLFEWYPSDFNQDPAFRELLQRHDIRLDASNSPDFLEYDWSLNE